MIEVVLCAAPIVIVAAGWCLGILFVNRTCAL